MYWLYLVRWSEQYLYVTAHPGSARAIPELRGVCSMVGLFGSSVLFSAYVGIVVLPDYVSAIISGKWWYLGTVSVRFVNGPVLEK